MNAAEVLELDVEGIGTLERPVMLVALSGWFDAAGAATEAVTSFVSEPRAITIGGIDPDPFYDFTAQRPLIELTGDVAEIVWPANEIVVQRNPGHRDVVAVIGVEPHLSWRTYIDAIVTTAQTLGCQAIVTAGSGAEALPHTRVPPVTGSTSSADLARRLGLVAPSYQGVTGLIGALHTAVDGLVPSISLRVGVPHYLMNSDHPQSTAALVRHLSHVLDVPNHSDYSDEIDSWRDLHDDIVANDDQLKMYVGLLEAEFDRRAEAAIPTADDLGAEFEAFLRDQRDE